MTQPIPCHRPDPRHSLPAVGVTLATALAATPAAAHHPMGGAMPSTAWEGFLSGLAHPVIGVDHLAFMVAMAAWLALARRPVRSSALAMAAFAGLSLIGTVLQSRALAPSGEAWLIAASLLGVAGGLWLRTAPSRPWLLAGSAAAGLGHGLAFGEAAIGVEAAPLGSYLLGLATVELLLMGGVFMLLRRRHGPAPGGPAVTGGALSLSLAGATGAVGLWVLGAALMA